MGIVSVGNFYFVALLHSFGTKPESEETSGKEFWERCEGNYISGDRRALKYCIVGVLLH